MKYQMIGERLLRRGRAPITKPCAPKYRPSMIDADLHLIHAKTCVVAFASGGGDFSEGVPHFEFGRSLEAMGVAYVLLRDSTGFSCQYGIDGIGPRAAVVAYLKILIMSYPRVMLIGLSVGALTALMYGQLISEGPLGSTMRVYDPEIIAMSPYTSLGDNPNAVFGEGWETRCPFPTDVPMLINLQPIFPNGPIPRVRAFISDGDGTSEDRHHAERIGITDITLVPGASHSGLGKLMRDNGMLRQLIIGE